MPKTKGKIAADILKWRRKQKRGAIMEPSTFESIRKSAASAGATDPEAVAGKAYWSTVKSKYAGRKK